MVQGEVYEIVKVFDHEDETVEVEVRVQHANKWIQMGSVGRCCIVRIQHEHEVLIMFVLRFVHEDDSIAIHSVKYVEHWLLIEIGEGLRWLELLHLNTEWKSVCWNTFTSRAKKRHKQSLEQVSLGTTQYQGLGIDTKFPVASGKVPQTPASSFARVAPRMTSSRL